MKLRINEKYILVDLKKSIIIYSFLVLFCVYLCIDNFRLGNPSIGLLALFCAVMTAIALSVLAYCKYGKHPRTVFMHIAVIIQCFVYWITFSIFLYTGGTGGTSIFLFFAAAPACFYFFNLFYSSVFCFIFFIIMAVYMWTPLHLAGYAFPEMYYQRLPVMYLVETFMCAIAQYQMVKARIRQESAMEDVRRANQAKSDFLTSMSHEIRTPINAVLGMNEMILRESLKGRDSALPGPEEARGAFGRIVSYAGDVKSAGSNLLSIINDILDLSKIEAGKMTIMEGSYQLSSILIDVSNMILFKAKDKSLEYIAEVDPGIPDHLYGDSVRVRQIMTNLLNNAVKYTKQGSVRLRVGYEPMPARDQLQRIRLILSVEDTGIGIRPEDIGKLFVKFQRVDMQQNNTVEGTGLGLSITRNLVEMMGGSIDVKSDYGAGSVFTVTIPQAVVSAGAVGDFQARFLARGQNVKAYRASFRAPDAHILVVDDTKMNLTVAVGLLKDTQVRIDTAGGGEEAVEMARARRYDLILMDQRMPWMDGTEALRRIRAQEGGANRETPVICLTANAIIGAKERYLAEGFSDFLTKPIDSQALEQMLIRHLPKEKVRITQDEPQPAAARRGDGSGGENPPDPLEAAGIDRQAGLRYCQDDPGMYGMLLGEYVRDADEKTRKLQQYYTARDWKQYAVYVHSLKSTSRMVGASALSEIAANLEAAADAGRAEVILDGHDGMLGLYRSTVEAIRRATGAEAGPASGSGDEILEFLPEQPAPDGHGVS